MRTRWLLCLFTYNRPGLLANAVRSIDRFFPWGDRLVIDDGSSDPRVQAYLRRLERESQWRFVIRERVAGRNYGGYYDNMRWALERALSDGYDYCFFFEDDEQIVWRKDDYPAYVERVFSCCPDAIQLQPLFFRRIIPYAKSIEYIRTARAYRSNRGFTTTGIWNLATVRRYPDYRFICANGDDMPANSRYWMKRGYRVYFQFDPTVAILPWVRSRSESTGDREDGESAGWGEFLLKPLDEAAIQSLQGRHPSLPAYQEYFSLSRENTAGPIWHQRGQSLHRFYSLCRQVVEEEDRAGQSPLPVPVLDSCEPTRIPPLQSHEEWNPAGVPRSGGPAWKRILPTSMRRVHATLLNRGALSPRDYVGYLRLRLRLQLEQRAIALGREVFQRTSAGSGGS